MDTEDSDEEEENADTDIGPSEGEVDTYARKHKPNRRQRLRRRQLHAAHGNSTATYKDAQWEQLQDEEVRDAVALENVLEADWQAIRNETECSGVEHNVRRAQQMHTTNSHNHLQTHTQPLQTTTHMCLHGRNGSSRVPEVVPQQRMDGKGLPELACKSPVAATVMECHACLCDNGRAAAGEIEFMTSCKGSHSALSHPHPHAIGRRLLAKGSQNSTGARRVTFQDDTNCQNRKCGNDFEDDDHNHDHNHDYYTTTTTTQPRLLHDHNCPHNAHNHNGLSCVRQGAPPTCSQLQHNHNHMHDANNSHGSSRVLLNTRFKCHPEPIDRHSSPVDCHHKVNDVQSARIGVVSSGLSVVLTPTDERVMPQEWWQLGDELVGLETLQEEPPAPKLTRQAGNSISCCACR